MGTFRTLSLADILIVGTRTCGRGSAFSAEEELEIWTRARHLDGDDSSLSVADLDAFRHAPHVGAPPFDSPLRMAMEEPRSPKPGRAFKSAMALRCLSMEEFAALSTSDRDRLVTQIARADRPTQVGFLRRVLVPLVNLSYPQPQALQPELEPLRRELTSHLARLSPSVVAESGLAWMLSERPRLTPLSEPPR